MRTYQDLQEEIAKGDVALKEFVYDVITDHKSSDLYQEAIIAEEYDRRRNRTIIEYQKLLYTVQGVAVPDNWSANFKMARGFFPLFVTQETQYLLGNGVSWINDTTEKKLGTRKKSFDAQIQNIGHKALVGGVAFGFFNKDHMDVFGVDEFAPLYDEETGFLRAGVRFWQIDPFKPLRATLYEEDGYTDYIWNRREVKKNEFALVAEILHPKRFYKEHTVSTEIDGLEITDGENYPGFPIVPLWGNKNHQSELTGLREQIDCYDLIKSGFANTVDEASYIYWAIQNAGGMDDMDLAKFVERMKVVHAAVVENNGAKAEAHTIEAPFQSREALLDRLEKDLFKDAMALDPERIASGAVTATQIRAAYDLLNEKVDGFEYCVNEFIMGILDVAGIEDEPSFTRSAAVNAQEEIQTVIMAAEYLADDYVTEKVLTILGDADKAEDMIKQMEADELKRGAVDDFSQNDDISSMGSQNSSGLYTGNRRQNGEKSE